MSKVYKLMTPVSSHLESNQDVKIFNILIFSDDVSYLHLQVVT